MPIIFKGFAVCSVCGKEFHATTVEMGRLIKSTPIVKAAKKEGWLFERNMYHKLTGVYCPEHAKGRK